VIAQRLETQVVVVGAGPVGLMLAGELRLGGTGVVVLDQRDAPTTESRASTLHARTMEILDSRGLLGALGTPPCELRGHFGGIPLDLSLPSSYPGQWKVPQTRTEEVLQERAVALGATLLRRHRVRAVRTAPDHVEAVAAGPSGPVRVRGRFLAGCDGEHSTVRRLAGASFPGRDARRELLRADVGGIAIPDRRFQRLPNGLAIAARRGDGVTRVMVHEFGSLAGARPSGPGPADVSSAWKAVTGEDISGGAFLWVNAFSDANRQLARYRHDRILFAGDAAHQQMPIGGQALNLGLQDAVNLGWKLAAELAGLAPAGLLDSYHTERHAVGRRVLANIRAQALLLLGNADIEPVRALLGELIALPDVRARLAAMIGGLDIRYDVGPGDDPLLGARLPAARLVTAGGAASSTAALLRTGRGLLLSLGDPPEARLGEVAPWADRVDAVTAVPVPDTAPAPLRRGGAVLVRPDGHIVWTASAGTPLPAALLRWFGPARGPASRTAN